MQYNAFVTIECRIVHQLAKIRRQNLASGFINDSDPFRPCAGRGLKYFCDQSEWEVVGLA